MQKSWNNTGKITEIQTFSIHFLTLLFQKNFNISIMKHPVCDHSHIQILIIQIIALAHKYINEKNSSIKNKFSDPKISLQYTNKANFPMNKYVYAKSCIWPVKSKPKWENRLKFFGPSGYGSQSKHFKTNRWHNCLQSSN